MKMQNEQGRKERHGLTSSADEQKRKATRATKSFTKSESLTAYACNAGTDRRKVRACAVVSAKQKHERRKTRYGEKEGKGHTRSVVNSTTATTAAAYRFQTKDCVQSVVTKQC
ncbi:MAG: hypothetical protein II264_02480 [Ruminococcus sp.]|nr:hypothetical protein [Ruminococcus sp.]